MTDTATGSDLLDSYYPSMGDEADTGQSDTVEESETEETEFSEEQDSDESETTTEETDDDERGEPEYEVTISGRAEKVTKAELIKGYQRQADYTRKTMAHAKDVEVFTAERANLDNSLKLLSGISDDIQKLVMGDLGNVDWEDLRVNDPSEYLRMKEVVQGREGSLKGVIERFNKLEAENIAKEQLALPKVMGWDHPEKGEQRRKEDIALLTETYGNSPAFAKAKDAETMAVFIDAARFRKLQKAKAELKPELKKAPKVSKSAKVTKSPGKNWLDDYYK